VADNTALVPSATDSYRELLSGKFQKQYEQARHAFDKFDLSAELGIIRAMLMQVIERMGAPEAEDRPKVGEVITLTKEIRQLVKQIVEVEDRFRSMIPLQTVRIFTVQLLEIIEEEVKDSSVRERIAKRCGSVALPANEREADTFRRAVQEGRVPSPDA